MGLWRPFTSVLPAFQSGIKYYVFLLVFSSAISLCFVDSSLLSLLLFGRIPFRSFVRRYGLRAKHSGFRFFLLCPSVSDFGKPTTVKYSSYHVLSLLLVCSPFPSLHPFSKLYSHFLTLPGLFRFGLLKQEFLVMFSTSMKL